MSNSLHILNGDSTLQIFQQSSLEGQTFVWREVLCDGPIHSEFNNPAFWEQRKSYMSAFVTTAADYEEKVLQPFKSIEEKIATFDEIVLWFEYDLFCQINMLTLIHWLGELRSSTQTISLVCSGKMDESDKLYGLGELKPEQLEKLFQNRLKLNTREFNFASGVYQAYCSPNPDSLYTYILMPSDEFVYTSDALSAHFRRFPYVDSGLSEIEQKILELIGQGVDNANDLVGQLLRWQKHYGFGDLQYFQILNDLKPLFSDFENLELKVGTELSSAIQHLDRNKPLGGAYLKDWNYDPSIGELVNKLDQ
ncbi:MAG TPA: hypothetical protein VIN11_02390 [Roseivirga sp.]